MKGTSKVIMAATLVMVVSLAMVLALILLLLAELYCSLLLRRRRRTRASAAAPDPEDPVPAPAHPRAVSAGSPDGYSTPLRSFYAHGVIQAPRSLLFPATAPEEVQKRPDPAPEDNAASEAPDCSHAEKPGADRLVYISNPVFENAETPFETPDTSPSRLEAGSSGSGTESPGTPPLTPMKKLPAEACSVSLRDARSLATSGSESNSNNGRSSSSSGSPRTSPSW